MFFYGLDAAKYDYVLQHTVPYQCVSYKGPCLEFLQRRLFVAILMSWPFNTPP